MIFTETSLSGAFVVDPDPHRDERGYFARTFCQEEFGRHGMNVVIAQSSVAFNAACGTLRGLHFRYPPRSESKLVRCLRGSIVDVIVDLRPESATFLEHDAVRLDADSGRAIYVPERFAHGYQVLEDATEVSYAMSDFHAPSFEDGLPHDDPRLGVCWPLPVTTLSDKDRAWPPLAGRAEDIRERMAAGRDESTAPTWLHGDPP